MVSVEVVGSDRVFVEGDIIRNKDLVGLVKLSEVQRIFELFIDNRLVIKYNT